MRCLRPAERRSPWQRPTDLRFVFAMREHSASRLQLTKLHCRMFVACAILILIDGYDGAVLTYAAPAIAANLMLDPAAFGPLFAAHLVGTILGFGPSGSIADRRGRRPVIIGATLLFTVFTFATATASTFASILVYRLLTGVGLGAAASNTLALASEYSPGRCRATVVAAIYSALPMGAVVGGYVAVVLIRLLGWHSVFVLGGGLGIAALVIALGNIPESICFLRASGRPASRVYQILARYGLRPLDVEVYEEGTGLGSSESPFKNLFVEARATGTLALWLTFFVSQLLIYFIFTWTPIVFKTRGLSSDLGIMASATLNLGGVVGGVCLARLIDSRGARAVLVASYIVAFIVISGFGSLASTQPALVLSAVALIGFVLNGSNVNLVAVATRFYPTRSRSTGVGWAMGIGRAGAIVGSLIGGVLLRAKFQLSVLYPLVGSALLLAALAVWIMHGRGRSVPVQAGLN